MQILQLQYFCAIARHGNISRAAEELWISQSALSKAINSLEDELGVRLFDRVGRSISLNESGEFFHKHINQLLLELDDTIKQTRDVYNHSANSVHLLLSAANFSSNWIWRKFNDRHPEIFLQINSCYTVTSFDIMQSDFHIFATPSEYDNIECVKLLEEDLMLAMGRNHPLAQKEDIRLIDTKPYKYQTLTLNENLRMNLDLFGRKAGFQPQVGFSTVDSHTFFEMLSSNDYLAIIPRVTAKFTLNEDIILKTIIEPHCSRSIFLSWNPNRYMSEAGKTFLEFCKDVFQEETKS